ncbi:Carboxylesterase 4A [Lachnellula suecica]|uniref:Carboxylic ester hydrolase n=1 Tax=Lachnellula suecica TaxID=602035 RepID=A0A8T9C9A2_9HELO|nr:Carboxylesterase 4A [Lachnellula suecica]
MGSQRKARRLGLVGTAITFGLVSLWFMMMNNPRGRNVPAMKKNRPSVTLRQGTVLGLEEDSSHGAFPQVLEEFLGIPYALSTERQRRFKPPVPVTSSKDEIDAGSFGARCPSGPGDAIIQSEDCLNLNIFRPKIRDENEKLPVLVYVHGGSFNFGSGSSRAISSLVAWSESPMIGISFNYRVGAFGFLPSKLAAKEGLLNLGLKDQELLLKWVQDNIAAFGGDPDNVTIMGLSAGAHSVGHHVMHNPESPPLFHRAIIESGATTARAVYRYDNAIVEKQFQEFLSHLNLETVSESNIFNKLRALPTSQIKQASEAVFDKYNPSIRWPFQPVIDGPGGMIPIAPIKAWRTKKWHKIPILTGFNTNEGAMFVPSTLSKSQQFTAFFRTLLPGLSSEDLETLNKVYPDPISHPTSKYAETRKGLAAQFKRVEQAYGHFAYIAPVRQTVNFAASGPAPIYLYHFAANSSIRGGADHGDHASFVTYNKETKDISPTIAEIAGTMHAYWTSFITTGDPNKLGGRFEDRPVWPKYVLGKAKKMLFGEGNDERAGQKHKGKAVQVVDDSWAKEECDFWWERTEKFEV